MVLGSIAYDALGRRFFFITSPAAGQFELYTVNLATQVTTHVPLASGSGYEPIFDPIRGRLLTLGVGTNPAVYSVLAVDPATGTYTAVTAVAPSPLPVVLGSSAYDPVGQRFFFITSPAAGQFELYTVNLATQVTTHVPLASGSGYEPIFAFAAASIPFASPWVQIALLAAFAFTGLAALSKHLP